MVPSRRVGQMRCTVDRHNRLAGPCGAKNNLVAVPWQVDDMRLSADGRWQRQLATPLLSADGREDAVRSAAGMLRTLALHPA